MAMTLNEADKHTMASIRAGNAVIWISDPGAGKSDTHAAIYRRERARYAAMGKRTGFGCHFLATQTPTDIIGVPFRGELKIEGLPEGVPDTVTTTDPTLPLWMMFKDDPDDPPWKALPAWCFDWCYLLFDEFGQAEPDTKRGAAEIARAGNNGRHSLPPGSARIMLTNEGNRNGVTKDFDFSITRRNQLFIRVEPKDWLVWADHSYKFQGQDWLTMPLTKAFIHQNPLLLSEAAPAEQGPFSNPRTVCMADRYIQCITEVEGGKIPIADQCFQETLNGYVGAAVARAWIGFMQYKTELPSYEDIVMDPVGTPVPDRMDLRMLLAYEMAGYTQREDLAKVLQFMERLPKDLNVAFVEALLRRDYNSFFNHPTMMNYVAKNAAMLAVMASLGKGR